jgi:type IV pilus biogenesis protein CpaD/CtpE
MTAIGAGARIDPVGVVENVAVLGMLIVVGYLVYRAISGTNSAITSASQAVQTVNDCITDPFGCLMGHPNAANIAATAKNITDLSNVNENGVLTALSLGGDTILSTGVLAAANQAAIPPSDTPLFAAGS